MHDVAIVDVAWVADCGDVFVEEGGGLKPRKTDAVTNQPHGTRADPRGELDNGIVSRIWDASAASRPSIRHDCKRPRPRVERTSTVAQCRYKQEIGKKAIDAIASAVDAMSGRGDNAGSLYGRRTNEIPDAGFCKEQLAVHSVRVHVLRRRRHVGYKAGTGVRRPGGPERMRTHEVVLGRRAGLRNKKDVTIVWNSVQHTVATRARDSRTAGCWGRARQASS